MPVLHHHPVTAESNPSPHQWMLVLHGIFGAGRNWASVARRFVGERPEWGAVLVDLRQHGRSMGFAPPHDLESTAQDLRDLVAQEGFEAHAILGHSFGGKVALVYSRDPATPLRRVWVADSTPDAREPHGSAYGMLRVLRESPGPFAERLDGVQAVLDHGYAPSVARWMSTNLIHSPQGYVWRLDPDDMESLLLSFFDTDAWDAVEAPEPGTHVHVIRALDSSILTDAACKRVEAAEARTHHAHLHQVRGGHWLNADNPDALQALLLEHMD